MNIHRVRDISRNKISSGHNRISLHSPMAVPTAIIVKDPEILGGIPVFRGTRVPFQALIDYIEAGQTLTEFLEDFPTVTREEAISALEAAKTLLVDQLQ